MRRENWIGLLPFYLLVVVLLLGATQFGSDAVTAISNAQPLKSNHTIIIDAGHGGVDGGATSCTGVLESQLNLEISLRLEDLLHLLGYRTLMIRKENISVYTEGETIAQKKISDLKERVRIVNSTENAVLISIHQNTFSDNRYGGAQVFYANTEQSRELAQILQNSLVTTINSGSNRQCKKATGVYLMNQIENTGILIECGFLSNPTEEALLRSSTYQIKLCCVIASAISNFTDKA